MHGDDFFELRRLELLSSVAYAAQDPFHAVIGCGRGAELLAIALGVRRQHPLRSGSKRGSVVCFHRSRHGDIGMAKDLLRARDRVVRRAHRRKVRPIPPELVVRFVEADEGRDSWECEVAALLRGGPERFGLVVHLGVGDKASIRKDLDIMLPMMSDRTEVILCGMDKRAPQIVFQRLVRQEAWSGIWRSGIAVAELRRLPIA